MHNGTIIKNAVETQRQRGGRSSGKANVSLSNLANFLERIDHRDKSGVSIAEQLVPS